MSLNLVDDLGKRAAMKHAEKLLEDEIPEFKQKWRDE